MLKATISADMDAQNSLCISPSCSALIATTHARQRLLQHGLISLPSTALRRLC